MRLFIAIPIPDDVQEYIRAVQNKLPKKGIFLNNHFHLTLQFLGDSASEEQLQKIKSAIAITFEQSSPDKYFLFQLRPLQTFKNRFGQIRVIWTGLKISKILLEFQKKLEKNLEAVGFKNEKVFIPHLTLARVKLPQTQMLEKDLQNIVIEERIFEVNEMHLIQTLLKPEGATYKVLEKYMWEEEK
ncbi:2'-5' RNA ligase [Candidatus Peregrinibacteria bacterium RIFOXYB2_FULL_32_7]|nr:MAG: 2'-5' RNA ligase [Candidatus Peregrinibacteria bacterium RIFOXYB2_FULL_32_7]